MYTAVIFGYMYIKHDRETKAIRMNFSFITPYIMYNLYFFIIINIFILIELNVGMLGAMKIHTHGILYNLKFLNTEVGIFIEIKPIF